MKFVDEARIEVQAGKGGRLRVVPAREVHSRRAGRTAATAVAAAASGRVADRNINTLIDYRYARAIAAKTASRPRCRLLRRGGPGHRAARAGGHRGRDDDTGRNWPTCRPWAARAARQGRRGGLGNLHFKSSTNRAPRQKTPG
jgi:GTP-binding protein